MHIKTFALLFAVLHLAIKESPEYLDEIKKLEEDYAKILSPGTPIHTGMEQCFEYLKLKAIE